MLIVVAMVILLLLLLLWFIGIALMTHWFLETKGERLRIAEAMLRPQNAAPDPGNRWRALEAARAQDLQNTGRFVTLYWGSIEPLQRLRRAFRRIHSDVYKEYGISHPPKRRVTDNDLEPLFESTRFNSVKVRYIQHGLRLLQAFYDESEGRPWVEVTAKAAVEKARLDPDDEDVDEALNLLRQEGLVEFTPTLANIDAWRITYKGVSKLRVYKRPAQGPYPDTEVP